MEFFLTKLVEPIQLPNLSNIYPLSVLRNVDVFL